MLQLEESAEEKKAPLKITYVVLEKEYCIYTFSN